MNIKKNFIILMLIVSSANASITAGQSIIPPKPPAVIPPSTNSDVVGILGAFPEEVKLLLSNVEKKTEFVIQRITFTEGILKGQHVVIAHTGIGKVNASMTTILLIEHFHPREILFTGIAGAINPALSPGDLVIGTTLAHHDYGTLTPEGTKQRPTRDPSTLQENPVYFPSDTSLISKAFKAGRLINLEKIEGSNGARTPTLTSGIIVTGDVFVSSDIATRDLRKKMNAEATEMEGAAVAQISYQQQIPFLVIRSMSDNAGNNAYADMKNFYQVAARNSANLVMAILEINVRAKSK